MAVGVVAGMAVGVAVGVAMGVAAAGVAEAGVAEVVVAEVVVVRAVSGRRREHHHTGRFGGRCFGGWRRDGTCRPCF